MSASKEGSKQRSPTKEGRTSSQAAAIAANKWVDTQVSGFGLEEIGIPGRDYLREALTNCSDPLKAIEEFQVLINKELI